MEKVKVLMARPNKAPYVEEITSNANEIYGLISYQEMLIDENVYLLFNIVPRIKRDRRKD